MSWIDEVVATELIFTVRMLRPPATTSSTERGSESGETRTVRVQHRFIRGLHIYTSSDVYGLYIAAADEEMAYTDVAPAIEILLRYNERIECVVEPKVNS